MISVCVATFNGEKYIKEQLISILSQLKKGDEIIISDDGSTDTTLDIIAKLQDSRIKVVHRTTTKKYRYGFDIVTHNFENALLHARGELIFLSDQDDLWLPNKVAAMEVALRTHLLALSDCKVSNENLQITHKSYFELNGLHTSILGNLVKNSFLGSCMAFRRELLHKAIPFPRQLVPHDIWLGLLALHYGKVAYLRIPLIIYRRHSGTTSTSCNRSTFSLWLKIKLRIYCLSALIERIIRNK